MAQILCWANHIQGFPKVFQPFSFMYLCWWEEKIWWMSWAGTGSRVAGAHCGGEGSCSCRTLSRAPLGQVLTKARLCVLHLITLLSDWLAAVMLGLYQNLLMSCKYWSPLPLRKIQVPSYMFMGSRKIMLWSRFVLRFQNCSLVISLLSTGMLINNLCTL